MPEEPICVVCNFNPAEKIYRRGRRHVDPRWPEPTHKKQCGKCTTFCKSLVATISDQGARRVDRSSRERHGHRRRNWSPSPENFDTNAAANYFNEIWRELETEIQQYKIGQPIVLERLIAGKEIYQGIEAYIKYGRWRRSEQQVINPPTSVDSLIEALGPNMNNHDKFLVELSVITDDDCNPKDKLDSLRALMRKWRNAGGNELTDPWLSKIQQAKIRAAEKDVIAEIDRRKAEEIERRREKFSKLGPDMPQSLADAMAIEKIPQSQAAQIFREGWHRDDLTFEIMTLCLNGDLSFENASWMQKNSNHERLISGILSGKMDLDLAKHLFTLGFGENPDATGAILDGNEIELVAEMYGITLPVVQEEIEQEPEVEVEPEPVVEETKEWRGRFDED